MLLADIRSYLKKRKIISLEDVALHFDIAHYSANFALDYWVKRGKVSIIGTSCGASCKGCGTEAKRYQWQEINATPIQWL